jgi:hypothetical protein
VVGDAPVVEHAEMPDESLQPAAIPRRADDDVGRDPPAVDEDGRVALQALDLADDARLLRL